MEPPQARNSEDGEAAVAAEGLQQGEVDLQGHVGRVVGRQDAQDHAVGISEGRGGRGKRSGHGSLPDPRTRTEHKLAFTHVLRCLADS